MIASHAANTGYMRRTLVLLPVLISNPASAAVRREREEEWRSPRRTPDDHGANARQRLGAVVRGCRQRDPAAGHCVARIKHLVTRRSQ